MVLVYNGSGSTNADKLKLYLNAIERTGGTYSGAIDSSIGLLSNSGYTEVGRTPSIAYFNGKISNIRIYNLNVIDAVNKTTIHLKEIWIMSGVVGRRRKILLNIHLTLMGQLNL